MNSNDEKRPATMPALPVDVIVDILSRLPAKTLLRFRCLSKQFRSIIDGPDFINRHLQYHSLEQRLILYGTRSEFFLLDLDSVDNACKLELPFEDWGHGYGVYVIGSCDGLLVLRNPSVNRIGLWNISTKKHQLLPKGLTDFNEQFVLNKDFDVRYGFGRDSATDDYKLVRIENCYATHVTQVSVYSLKASRWRRVDGFPPYSSCFLSGIGAPVEGTLNWLAELMEVEDRGKDFIVSFDLKNESFSEVSLPDTIGEIEESELHVMVLGGCFCLIHCYLDQPVYDIWVMKEYGLKESWTKMCSFLYDDLLRIPPFPQVFVYPSHGDKIMTLQVDDGKVIRYDLEEGKSEIANINELPLDIMGVSIYVESLVSPNFNN